MRSGQRLKRSKIVRLDLDVYEELVRAKGELTAKEGRSMSLSDALRRMIEAWYEKAREEVKVTKAKCSSCGREFYADAEARYAICPHCGTVLRKEEVRA
jgi:DNA-directed RNA polymerase subunit RPC12/RpoP